jgi:hypothetical protein
MTQTDDDADVLGEDLPPTPRTPVLVIALIVLNLLAALGFAYLLLMDLDARNRWAYEVFKRDVAMMGIPLKEEESPSAKAALAAQAASPRLTLEPAWLEKAYKDRTGKSLQDKFLPAMLDPQYIRPQDLSEELLKDLFSNHGKEPVATQDAEIARVKANLPKWIDAAAEGAAGKTKDKLGLLYDCLLPLAHLTDKKDQVDELDRAIKAANAKQLDELAADAAKRKLLVDLLLRLEEFRPHNPTAKEDKLLRAAALEDAKGQSVGLTKDRYKVKTDELMDMLSKRVDETLADQDVHGAKRHDLEKRRSVAFLLFNLGQFKGADGTPLYPQGRAEVVSGVREYTQAADTTALVLERLEKRVLDALNRDRGPYRYPLDYRVHDPKRFADRVTELLEEMEALPKKKDDAKADPKAVQRREAFRNAVAAVFTKQLKQMKSDDKETAGQKVLKSVNDVMKNLGIAITEDKDDQAFKLKVKQALFERAVVRMTDGYEPGFVAEHHDLVNLTRELSGRIQEMDNRLKELQGQATKLEAEYKERLIHKAGVEKKLVEAREKTLKMANDLARLQDDRFRAQVELADADRRNLLMERRIRELEQSRKKGKGRRPSP